MVTWDSIATTTMVDAMRIKNVCGIYMQPKSTWRR
jgi:hypothetical protein